MGMTCTTICDSTDLDQLRAGEEAIWFAALVDREQKKTQGGLPYWVCEFRDRQGSKKLKIWSSDSLFAQARDWCEGQPMRLHLKAKGASNYGPDYTILAIRDADADQDGPDGYTLDRIFEISRYGMKGPYDWLRRRITRGISSDPLRTLVLRIWDAHEESIRALPAAQKMHHAFPGGLAEHVMSLFKICMRLGRHYKRYYPELAGRFDYDVLLAAAALHDIGKLCELEHRGMVARYTTRGKLLGHIVMGRDLVRATAAEIPGFPEETLLRLEHAILAHHNRKEYGSPVLPMTPEALILAHADDLDAKMNQMARALSVDRGEDEFTESIRFGDDYRGFFRGLTAQEPPSREALAGEA